jgi:hypothetical protein
MGIGEAPRVPLGRSSLATADILSHTLVDTVDGGAIHALGASENSRLSRAAGYPRQRALNWQPTAIAKPV